MLLRDRFLTLDPPGGWLDRLDHNGGCVNEYMPASTLYHLLGAIDELSRFAGRPNQSASPADWFIPPQRSWGGGRDADGGVMSTTPRPMTPPALRATSPS